MLRDLASLLATIAVVYVALVVVYGATGGIVTRLNRPLAAAKIQCSRQTAAALVRRDRRQSLRSLAVIAALFGTGHWSFSALGWGWPASPLSTAPGDLLRLVLSFVASLFLFDTWFYWAHRLIHTRPLYKRVHRWHHLTVTPVVWSNNSDLLADNLFLQSYWLVAHLLIPIAPAALIAHKLYDQVTGIIGHSGFEHGGRLCWPPSPMVGVTHHDQHHRYFRCNYATHFSLWDRLMGTLHPDHDSELKHNIAATEEARRSAVRLSAG